MFSVVIPLYNKAHTIASCLNSVLGQVCQDFEVIIVDDGSRDDGAEIVRERFKDPRIKLHSQLNAGVSAARNRGVELATRDYVAFLDADDDWAPNYLEEIRDCIRRFPNAGLFCAAGTWRHADGTEGLRLARKYSGQKVEVNFFENPHVFLHTSAAVVKKSEFLRTTGFPVGMKRHEDYALFYSLALRTPFVYCGIPLSFYNGGVEGQATGTPTREVLEHVIARYNHVYSNYQNCESRNPLFLTFLRYELRQEILIELQNREWECIERRMDQLSDGLLANFLKIELRLYICRPTRPLAICCIYFTKLLWRLGGFPRVGEYKAYRPSN